jgi:Leucine-rich repeat (LRR) protein
MNRNLVVKKSRAARLAVCALLSLTLGLALTMTPLWAYAEDTEAPAADAEATPAAEPPSESDEDLDTLVAVDEEQEAESAESAPGADAQVAPLLATNYSQQDAEIFNNVIDAMGLPLTKVNTSSSIVSNPWEGNVAWDDVGGINRITYINIYGYDKPGAIDLRGLTELTELYCSHNRLTSLNVSGLTKLELVYCVDNKLTSLNVSGCTELIELECDNNELTSLNVSGCTELIELTCSNNELTSLDVSGLTKLNDLTCPDNKLTSLNISGCTGLAGLYASKNKLSSLNPSGVPGLNFVDVTDNSLSSLDLRAATNLVTIVCEKNYLTSLNVSGLTKLEGLVCNDNRLSTLDVSGLSALVTLNCYNNNLTSINFSGAANLENLDCSENKLTSLNTAGLVSLGSLYCYDNALSALDFSSCPDLGYVDCGANQLTTLNFSGTHSAFKYLYCNQNALTTLNVNTCPNLETLECISNQLTSLSVNNCNKLKTLNCDNNRLTALALHGAAPLYDLYVRNNFFPSTAAITGPSITWGDARHVFGEQHDPGFVAVTNIIGLPTVATAGVPLTLSGTIVPQDATNQPPIEWEVVYDIDSTGGHIEGNTFTAVTPGRCAIQASVEDGVSNKGDEDNRLYKQWVEIMVRSGVSSVAVSGAGSITAKGGTAQLSAAVLPLGADQAVTWSGSNAAVATVSQTGLVTAKADGTVKIRATAKDGTGVYGEKTLAVSGQGILPDPGVKYAIGGASVKEIPDKAYTGKAIKPTPVVTHSGKVLKEGTHYTVNHKNNTNIGKATITINAKAPHTGSKTITYNIVPSKTSVTKAAAGKKQANVTWKKVSSKQKVTNYQIRYCVKGTNAWNTKTVAATSNSLKIKNLKKGKVYQIQVRSSKKISSGPSKGTYYSAWSPVKTSAKIK